ncbi:MAG TPA: hypothetical protein DD729_05560, partial [Rhodobacteraceae bacterium]|nr:hypothetical protein [Paracoccaceae bacterium]
MIQAALMEQTKQKDTLANKGTRSTKPAPAKAEDVGTSLNEDLEKMINEEHVETEASDLLNRDAG